jgi:ATP-binding cassette subfamily C (CFTR/MRP) protein 1
LKNINFHVAHGQLAMIIGPVGCGKTTLLQGILGETSIARGRVLISSSEMAFCDQTPWLTNVTLQDNITGFSKYDSAQYWAIIRACALNDDLGQLPDGDLTLIGSKGISLSGGQKQRVVSVIERLHPGQCVHVQR